MAGTLPPVELPALADLITPTTQGIAGRVLARIAAGNITLFAFDTGEDLPEHTAPFDALVLTLSGSRWWQLSEREPSSEAYRTCTGSLNRCLSVFGGR